MLFEFTDPAFKAQLGDCLANHRIYRTNFMDDPVQITERDETSIQRSVAARLLWAHIKYEMAKETTMVTYKQFWRYLSDNFLTFSPSRVVDYMYSPITSSSEASSKSQGGEVAGTDSDEGVGGEGRIIIFILNEVKSITNDYFSHCECNSDASYIRGMVQEMCQVQKEHGSFLFPIITVAKRGKLEEYMTSFRCTELPIGPLSVDEIKEIVVDLCMRAQACVKSQQQDKDVAVRADSSCSSTLPIPKAPVP